MRPQRKFFRMKILLYQVTLGLVSFLLFGCGKPEEGDTEKGLTPEQVEGLEFLEENSKGPGVVQDSDGVQYKIIDPGSDDKLKDTDMVFARLQQLDFQGNPVFGALNWTTVRPAGKFWVPAINERLSLIGEGGKIRFFLRWDLKGLDGVGKGGLGRDQTVVWDVHVKKVVDIDWAYRCFQNAFYYPVASMLIFDFCGEGKPDTLTGGEWRFDGGRYDPDTHPITPQSLVRISLKGSPLLVMEGAVLSAFRWEWVGPCAGIFVLPGIAEAESERIGEFIFGTNTGGQDWVHSYEALAYLDLDGSGTVDGRELDGVHVWVDRNGNGKPEREEVFPSEKIVSSINVSPVRVTKDDWAAEGNGVVMRDSGENRSSWSYGMRGVNQIGQGKLPQIMLDGLKEYAAAQGYENWEPPEAPRLPEAPANPQRTGTSNP